MKKKKYLRKYKMSYFGALLGQIQVKEQFLQILEDFHFLGVKIM